MTLSQTTKYKNIKDSYGGSDKSSASFLRSDHVTYNSVSKARDFGIIDNLSATLVGTVGTESGTNTLFFKVQTKGDSDLLISRNSLAKYQDQYISVGILNSERKQVPQTADNYAYQNEVINTAEQEFLLQMPAGTYYFTVSNSQWQSLPYSATLRVLLYRELSGAASGTATPYGRIALVKLSGAVTGTGPFVGTIPNPSTIKVLSGNAGGTATPAVAIPQILILLSDTSYGRIRAIWKLSGAATGSNTSVGTLTVSSPYDY